LADAILRGDQFVSFNGYIKVTFMKEDEELPIPNYYIQKGF
jgi:hypothetical protein